MNNSRLDIDLEKRLAELQNLVVGDTENDVREDFLKPLLELLGYKAETTNNIARERALNYSYNHIGKERKKIKHPDYILSVDGDEKWVLEAKKKTESLDYQNIQQVHSYAKHKEIQVEFYVLCNGDTFALYQTKDTHYKPIFEFKRRELLDKWYELSKLLSVEYLRYNKKDLTIIFEQIIPEFFDDKEKRDLIKWTLSIILNEYKIQFHRIENRNNREVNYTDFYVKDSDNKIGLIRYIYNEEVIEKKRITALTNDIIDNDIISYIYLVTTACLDKEASEFIDKYDKKNPHEIYIVEGETLSQLLIKNQKITIPSYKEKCKGSVDTIRLLATENKQLYWAVEENDNKGEPYRILIFHPKNGEFDIETLRLSLNQYKLFVGCLIEDGNQGINEFVNDNPKVSLQGDEQINDEIPIPQIPIAENFESDSACDPKDFIGRGKIKAEFWNFINDVQKRKTAKRNFTIEGQSGYGKSSLILKLEQESKDKDNIFLYQIDVRLLCQYPGQAYIIPSAVKKAVQESIDQGFIDLPSHTICISRGRSLFYENKSIKLVIDYLRENEKTIIICFDQFDYLFSRNDLENIYKEFIAIVTQVNSLKENFVLGFSCRIGIPLIENNIRDKWYQFKDIREVFEIKEFDEIESKEYLNKFSERLNKDKNRRLNVELKKWLQEHCAGFPYLFRQFCSSIYKYRDDSCITPKKVEELIEDIFKKELEDLNFQEKHILMKIAKDGNISGLEETHEKVLESLVKKRFLLCSGAKYIITSDIRREYYSSGILPQIATKYIPTNNVNGSLYAMRDINKFETKKQLIKELLVTELQYQESTAQNIWRDIQNIFYIEYNSQSDKITVPKEFHNSTQDYYIADYLSRYFERNLIIKKILQHENIRNSKRFDRKGFTNICYEIIVDGNDSLKKDSNKDYASRLLIWLCFAGLIELMNKPLDIYRISSGSDSSNRCKGNILNCVKKPSKQDTIANKLPVIEQMGLFP